jgi:hypothetical protein
LIDGFPQISEQVIVFIIPTWDIRGGTIVLFELSKPERIVIVTEASTVGCACASPGARVSQIQGRRTLHGRLSGYRRRGVVACIINFCVGIEGGE